MGKKVKRDKPQHNQVQVADNYSPVGKYPVPDGRKNGAYLQDSFKREGKQR